MRDLGAYRKEYDKSFEFKFVEPQDLAKAERAVHDMTPRILAMAGIDLDNVRIRVSETMRTTALDSTRGVWDAGNGWIIVKRDVLSSAEAYAGTILHAATRAASGAPGMTRKFEAALTQLLGRAAVAALRVPGARAEDGGPQSGV